MREKSTIVSRALPINGTRLVVQAICLAALVSSSNSTQTFSHPLIHSLNEAIQPDLPANAALLDEHTKTQGALQELLLDPGVSLWQPTCPSWPSGLAQNPDAKPFIDEAIFEQKDREDLAALTKEISKTHTTDAVKYYSRAKIYARQKKHQEAIEDCTTALKINPRYVSAQRLRALEKAKLGHLKEALADFTRIIELEPTKVEHLLGRAEIFIEQKNYQNAIADYSKAIAFKPLSLERLYFQRAHLYDLIGKSNLAAQDRRLAKDEENRMRQEGY